jgi:hypothetical protein
MPDRYNRFKVFLGADPAFAVKVTSGDRLLKSPSWTVPAGKWTKICAKVDMTMYIRVFGKVAGTKTSEYSQPAAFVVK